MTLPQLLQGVPYTGSAPDLPVSAVTCDSRQIAPGCVFFCLPGLRTDGHDHAAQALEQGATAVVCQRDLGLAGQILVEDTRDAFAVCCGNYFGNPARRLKLLAVTGTNGKTTVTYLVKHILEGAGKRVGLIGTIHNEIDDITLPAKYTTPDPLQLQTMFDRMVKAGCEYVVMEASSHAIDQKRLAGLHFEAAAFTNLTQDHLDYHETMERYFQAKRKLFLQCGTAVLNEDDEYGRRLMAELPCEKLGYSRLSDSADYTARDIKFSAQGSRFALLTQGRLARVHIAMPGLFSVSNALAAGVLCMAAGIDFETVVEGLSSCPGVTGRLEVLPTNTPFTVIRDYAHSPDGLQKLLETVREFAPGRILTLFGCGGNRDREKRPLMGRIAAGLSDVCIVTSDNPRDEDPEFIIREVLAGVAESGKPHKAIADRREAIRWALDNAGEGDILILAGKGHEDYQVLRDGTVHFDEKEIVLELLGNKQTDRMGEQEA